MEIFADSARGVYIPQHFAESARREMFKGISESDWADLASGPEFEWYWETWERVLNNAETIDGQILYHDGDLFIGTPQEIDATFGES